MELNEDEYERILCHLESDGRKWRAWLQAYEEDIHLLRSNFEMNKANKHG